MTYPINEKREIGVKKCRMVMRIEWIFGMFKENSCIHPTNMINIDSTIMIFFNIN